MANLYSKLGSTASKAITSQGAGEAGYAQMDYIDRMYDIKRQRLEKLFSTLGSGWEAVERFRDVRGKNKKIKDMFEALGYKVDTGFLGVGDASIIEPGSSYISDQMVEADHRPPSNPGGGTRHYRPAVGGKGREFLRDNPDIPKPMPGRPYKETLSTGGTIKVSEDKEISMFDAMMKSNFSIGDIFNLFKSKNGRAF